MDYSVAILYIHTRLSKGVVMSITFNSASTSTGELIGYAAACFAYGPSDMYRSAVYESAEKAIENHVAEHAGNEDCDHFVSAVPCYDTDGDPFVNMNNANAHAVLRFLGMVDAYGEVNSVGSADCADFRRKIEGAINSGTNEHLSLGAPKRHETSRSDRPTDYIVKRLSDLLSLVDFAESRDSRITWG